MTEKITKDIQEKIAQMQLLQQRLQVFTAQKQQFQLQAIEIENALAEIKDTKSPVYKLVGEILVEKETEKLKKELEDKKSEVDTRIKSIESQEEKTKTKAMELQKEVTSALEGK